LARQSTQPIFLGTIPQSLTALIALGAALAAWKSITTQREIARKRAALDFFTKTEMDKDLLSAYTDYNQAVARMHQFLAQGGNLDAFTQNQGGDYWSIRSYLNLHEFLAVGIKRGVLDDNVCYDFWSGVLERCYMGTRKLIEHVQSFPEEQNTYTEMVRLADRWRRHGQQ
jgi:hypothetical protein